MSDDSTRPDPARKAISRTLRFEILRRDNYTCRYCGLSVADGAVLTVDHVIPVTLGGGDEPSNLVAACRDCNYGKGRSTPDAALVEQVDELAIRFAVALDRASEIRRGELAAEQQILDKFNQVWTSWKFGTKDYEIPRSPAWRQTILNYLSAGLSHADLEAHVIIAMESSAAPDRTWRYFCAVCSNEIGRRQEIARRIIEGEV